MFKEFKQFALKGSMIDLSIGVVIGASFGAVIASLVNDLIMPPIGLMLGNVDFQNMFITLWGQHFRTLAEAKAGGAVTINYGVFINTFISFFIVAFSIFLLIKQMNRLRKKTDLPPDTKECPYCKMKINIDAVRCPHCTSDLKL